MCVYSVHTDMGLSKKKKKGDDEIKWISWHGYGPLVHLDPMIMVSMLMRVLSSRMSVPHYTRHGD